MPLRAAYSGRRDSKNSARISSGEPYLRICPCASKRCMLVVATDDSSLNALRSAASVPSAPANLAASSVTVNETVVSV